jgi:hypothetical protein
MFRKQIKALSPEEVEQLPRIRNRWQTIATSVNSIDREKASAVLAEIYPLMGYASPQISVVDSPYAFLEGLFSRLAQQVDPNKMSQLSQYLDDPGSDPSLSELLKLIVTQFATPFQQALQQVYGTSLRQTLENNLLVPLTEQIDRALDPQPKEFLTQKLAQPLMMQLVRQQESLLNNQVLISFLGAFEPYLKTVTAVRKLHQLQASVKNQQFSQFVRRFSNHLGRLFLHNHCLVPQVWIEPGSQLDFCISTLKLPYTQGPQWPSMLLDMTTSRGRATPTVSGSWKPGTGDRWLLLQNLMQHCGWIFAWENACVICDRPIKFLYDSKFLLHGEGEAALLFADGSSLYFHHGVALPKEYGQVHPSRWKSQWILEQENAELRRVLIEQIGYDRMCQELAATALDSWKEYTLLRLETVIDEIDEQPISLLKMTCPSTGHVHALRVPPEFRSAREAIQWVNWGIDPETFVMQS